MAKTLTYMSIQVKTLERAWGFARVTEEMRQSLSEAIGKAIQLDMITHEGLNLKAV